MKGKHSIQPRMRKTKTVQTICGLLYTVCLLLMLGIAIDPTDSIDEAGRREKEEIYDSENQGNTGKETDEETSGTKMTVMTETDEIENESKKTEEKLRIAITFDDGPSSSCTGRLLDGLKERGVKATFFLIGENAKENPELVKRLDEEGHLIGNHTYHHVEITKISDEEARKEIEETDEVIYSITGKHVEYMRPPFGSWQKDLELEMNVLPVMWTIDPLDWTTKNVDEIVNKVVSEAEEDDIILLHDCYDSSVDAALRIIDILQKEGFEFVTVDEMILN